MSKFETPVLLLTGYLGSGKTTLLNRILTNTKGIKFAVIVNDIGEVNIDATLIQQGGIVGKKDESLVALQNGCICCTLKMDLVEQINEIIEQQRFDYIVIEASGICEPEPIAQTICSIPSMGPEYSVHGLARLDCIATVVDALRMKDEFNSGNDLMLKNIDEEDIANLLIQQIEFCNIILLNKAAMVEKADLNKLKEIITALQPKAKIIECNYGDVDFDEILNTNLFNFESVATSATWIQKIEGELKAEDTEVDDHHGHEEEHEHCHHDHDDDDDDNEHCHHHHDDDHDEDHDEHDHEHHHDHHHHHHHDHEEGEAEEYGIGTYVYFNRKPFDINKFDHFVARKWSSNIIRAKGLCYFGDQYDMCYLFEQAGKQFNLKNVGQWYATMPKDQLAEMLVQDPILARDWDKKYGDRMQKLVFIGQKLDKAALKEALDACIDENF